MIPSFQGWDVVKECADRLKTLHSKSSMTLEWTTLTSAKWQQLGSGSVHGAGTSRAACRLWKPILKVKLVMKLVHGAGETASGVERGAWKFAILQVCRA